MRIVGGVFGGRKFNPPAKNWPTRPTTDFAKEGLFNILSNKLDFEDLRILDLFGGSGSISYEFISRGCPRLTYVDRHTACVKFVESVREKLKIGEEFQILRQDVFKYLKSSDDQFDLIFADPPYDLRRLNELPEFILNSRVIKKGTLLIVEHDKRHDFSHLPAFAECRSYGNVNFSFFQV